MKTFISICFFLLPTVALFAQDYIPVVINGEVFFSTELETAEGTVPAEVTVANFEKIEGQLYNRVFFKRNLEADMLIGYLREDPGEGEIYFRTTTSSQEFLVYDISLQEGESISLNARWCDGLAGDVATVVSVTESEGLRELVFDREVGDGIICETLTFIEGVGPSASLIFPVFRDAIAENGVAQRLCHASHEAIIYYPTGTNTDFCGGAITSQESLPMVANVEVFPNPVTGTLYLRNLPLGTKVQMHNNLGQLVNIDLYDNAINCQSLKPGLYLLRFQLTNGEQLVKKVLVR